MREDEKNKYQMEISKVGLKRFFFFFSGGRKMRGRK